MILVDASAVVEVIIGAPRSRRVVECFRDGGELIAPELIDIEVCSAVARLERAQTVSRAHAENAVRLFRDLPLHRIRHRGLLMEAWRRRHSLRVADAFYIACALSADAPMLTLDNRLIRSAPHGVRFVHVDE